MDFALLADDPVGDEAAPAPEGWVRPYRRRDGTVVGGYRRRG